MRISSANKVVVSFCLLLVVFAFAGTASSKDYTLLKKVQLGGEGGWDYLAVDTVNGRLFISRSSHVQVMDTQTDSLVGDISGTSGVHGIAFAYDLGKGYTSNGRESCVTVFDLKSLKELRKANVQAKNPDAIMYDDFSDRIFTFNGGSSSATAIDAKTDAVLGTVPLDGKPEFAVSDGKGNVFVNIEDKSELTEFDAKTLKVEKSWPLAPGEEPSGLAIDREKGRLFSGCSDTTMVISDIAAGKVIASVPIGSGVDATAFDPATHLAFSSNGQGTLTVVQEDSPGKFSVLQTVETQRAARTMALDPRTHTIYLSTAKFGPTPAPTADKPHPRPPMEPGSFTIVVVGYK